MDIPDWRMSSKEDMLKDARLWHAREDSWLQDKKNLSESNYAHMSMDFYLQKSYDEELHDLDTADTDRKDVPTPLTDAKTLCVWVANSMPHLAWPTAYQVG